MSHATETTPKISVLWTMAPSGSDNSLFSLLRYAATPPDHPDLAPDPSREDNEPPCTVRVELKSGKSFEGILVAVDRSAEGGGGDHNVTIQTQKSLHFFRGKTIRYIEFVSSSTFLPLSTRIKRGQQRAHAARQKYRRVKRKGGRK